MIGCSPLKMTESEYHPSMAFIPTQIRFVLETLMDMNLAGRTKKNIQIKAITPTKSSEKYSSPVKDVIPIPLPEVGPSVNQYYSCPLCDNQFTCRPNALRHMKSVHGNVRYECQICKKSFNRKDILKGHIMGSHELNAEVARAMVDCTSTSNKIT